METIKRYIRSVLRMLGLPVPHILAATYRDNQVRISFRDRHNNQLPRSIVKQVKFDPIHTENTDAARYNILSDQVKSGSVPHISSDSTEHELWLNWSCGRHGTKTLAFIFDCAWKGDPNRTFFGPKPRSGCLATVSDLNKQSEKMHSPSKANFWYVAWLTIAYADGNSQYRLVFAQDGNADHVMHDLEEVKDIGDAGWDLYEGDVRGFTKGLKDFVGALGKDQHKNGWYVAVAGDLGAPPHVPAPPFGTRMLPVWVHNGDGSDAFNSKQTHLTLCDTNGRHPITITTDIGDNTFRVILLDQPQT